jgi:transposase
MAFTKCLARESLQHLVESRRTLVAEKVRLTNRLSAALKSYYPPALEWFDDKDTQVFCDFLTQYPNLKSAQAAPAVELEQFFKTHHVVQAKTIHRRLEQIQQRGGVDRRSRSGRTAPTSGKRFDRSVKSLAAQHCRF